MKKITNETVSDLSIGDLLRFESKIDSSKFVIYEKTSQNNFVIISSNCERLGFVTTKHTDDYIKIVFNSIGFNIYIIRDSVFSNLKQRLIS